MKTKRQIVCDVLGLKQNECSYGDREFVTEFESRFGELTKETFRSHFDDVEFTEWVIENGY